MPFPESPRVIYERNPLTEVICQLKFPTILRIGTGDIANFQDRIRTEYPLYELREPAFEFVNVPKELSTIFQQLPFPKPAGSTTHMFFTRDRKKFISLSQDFLAFSETSYKQWEFFIEEVNAAERILQEIFSPAFYSRVGLRYKDLIRPLEFGVSGKKWNDLLKIHIAGELGDTNVADHISEIRTRTVIEIPEVPGGHVTLAHGLIRSKGDSGEAYLIDADFTLEKSEGIDGAVEILDTFNRLAGKLFRWAISDTLHTAMGPKVI